MELNHTIVWCRDKQASARFLTEMLGRPPPKSFLHFLVVDLDNGVSMDFMEQPGEIGLQHYAFLVSEAEFDAIHGRIVERGLEHWADPARMQPGQVNRHWGGRGVYFRDPDGNVLEILEDPNQKGLLSKAADAVGLS